MRSIAKTIPDTMIRLRECSAEELTKTEELPENVLEPALRFTLGFGDAIPPMQDECREADYCNQCRKEYHPVRNRLDCARPPPRPPAMSWSSLL
jgi:hypothetical protein